MYSYCLIVNIIKKSEMTESKSKICRIFFILIKTKCVTGKQSKKEKREKGLRNLSCVGGASKGTTQSALCTSLSTLFVFLKSRKYSIY